MLNWCQTTMAEIESRATGTVFGSEISKQNFRPIPVVLPPPGNHGRLSPPKLRRFTNKFTLTSIQSRTLATLRDTLLPKLLSGELSVAGSGLTNHIRNQ
jgi:type I restriction enzyme S subunit